ncbi:mechanosensitive ion channel domain-containing protein [Paracoccus sp. SCSIO 75233]|uniref:mechanosensitive ion channel domain-containing protein n=1 Tax=Paracoccus sp. SCSIO 75233 TaxID=3017782 RepID=UPI0022EFFF40|nr:mechanosensitive ion channel domain-containing protein [Paracoccus sp. SCSIO 75233]WBU53816.1 mechanosensitive ion channel [Paracoccus sp. SCSIO 75233]
MRIRCLHAVLLAAFLLVVQLASPGAAQEQQAPDYESWERFATQAEAALDDRTTADQTLESIRENAIRWRDEFEQAQDLNARRIATVREQITALGPVPGEGESEAEDIAARRTSLNEQLAELQAPGIKATEAYSRADSLVTQVDQIDRLRHAEEIMAATPSPLLPPSWLAAGEDAAAIGTGVVDEFSSMWAERGGIDDLPQLLFYLLAAAALLYGRRVVDQLPAHLGKRTRGDARAVVAFVASLTQILVPMIGIFLLAWALDATGLFGEWTRPLLLGLPLLGLVFFSGRWLVRMMFAEHHVAYDTLHLPPKQRNMARLYATGLALVTGFHSVVSNAVLPLSGFVRRDNAPPMIPYEVSPAGAGVAHFIIMLAASFFLFQIANILRRMVHFDGTDSPPLRAWILSFAGRALRIVVVVSLAAMMFGYVNASNALFWPSVKSLWLIGVLILLQDFLLDLLSMFRGDRDKVRASLAPIVLTTTLTLLSLPLFALIWGATLDELGEMWTQIMQGVTLGGINLSPGAVLTFFVVFGIGYLLTGWVKSAMRTQILPRTKLDQGAQTAAISGIGYIGVFLAALLAITSAGFDLSNLAIVAGALSVGIGFGLQTIVQNFVSGIILLIERPISVGDWVEAGGQQGIVQDVSVRSTRLKTFDQTDVIIPNSDLISQPVTNWTRGNARGRIIVPVGVAYGTDTRKVERILREIVEDQPTVLIDPAPLVLFQGFGADSLDFEIRAILSDIGGGLGVCSEMRHQIAARFVEEGIEIPYAQRDIWLRNPEALQAPKPAEKDKAPEPPEPPSQPQDSHIIGDLPGGDGDGDGDL